jgi:hypothetical protein
VGHRQKKGFFRNTLAASKRMTVADMTRPVTTQDEVALFFELHPQYTKNSQTDYNMMARQWNLRVTASLQQSEQQPGQQLGLKLAKHLQQFEKTVVAELARREACALLQVTHSLLPAAPAAATIEQAVSGLFGTLMEKQRKKQEEQAAASALASMQSQQQQQPKLQKGKGTAGTGHGGRGVGKTCSACADANIPGVPITQQHKRECKHFGRKFTESANKLRSPGWLQRLLRR